MIEKLPDPIQHALVKDLFLRFEEGAHFPRTDVAVTLMPVTEDESESPLEALLQDIVPVG